MEALTAPTSLALTCRWRSRPQHQLRTLVGAAGTAASCQEATYAPQQTTPLFDHLVGDGKQRRWHGETRRPGSLGVDNQLELGCLNDRQLCRFCALEDAADVDTSLMIRIR